MIILKEEIVLSFSHSTRQFLICMPVRELHFFENVSLNRSEDKEENKRKWPRSRQRRVVGRKKEERKRNFFYNWATGLSFREGQIQAPWSAYITLSILIIITQKTYMSSAYSHRTLLRFNNIQDQCLESQQSFTGFGGDYCRLVYPKKMIHHTLC